MLGGGKGSGSCMGGGESQDLGFCCVEDDAERGTKALESFDKNGEVIVREKSKSVIEVCMCSAPGATAIIAGLAVGATGFSLILESGEFC